MSGELFAKKWYVVCALRSRTLCREWAVNDLFGAQMDWKYRSEKYAKRKATELRKERVISDRRDGHGLVDRGPSFRKVWIVEKES